MTADYPRIETLLKAFEVAEILRVSRTQAYRLLASGEIPSLHFAAKTVRVRLSDLEKFIGGQPGNKEENRNA
ncbi:MAG: helix-turn-helix domain-containing protein [Planctomycetes bacterium]|nr:helix-turn-helix domain-containing protein [Planctomycetota bacterium]